MAVGRKGNVKIPAKVPERFEPKAVEMNRIGFPIVGIGASAGGLAAFEAFFSGMPSDTVPGMAFILVQHLAPDHKSILTELIQRYTRMQVFEVEDGMVVQPNCAYIIPPNRDMAFLNGALQLLEPGAARGQRLPIDFFFRSLAQDQHARAIGIVLSGTGSDGTLGVRAIKACPAAPSPPAWWITSCCPPRWPRSSSPIPPTPLAGRPGPARSSRPRPRAR